MSRELLEDKIYHYLCAQLKSHRLEVGTHLKAGDIATDLDVSRTSVRKAIIRLVDDGCIKLNDGGRPIVISLPKRRQHKGEAVFAYSNQTELAYWALIDAIFEGRLREGENVNGQELAESIGVSLGTVRQALDWLCRDGLLLRLPRRGWKVVHMNGRDLGDAFQIRSLLEPVAMARAAERITRDQLERMIADNERVLEDPEKFHEKDRRRVDYQFHRTLLDTCDSPILTQTIDPLVRKCMLLGVNYSLPKDVIVAMFDEHIQIAKSLLKKDLDQAGVVLDKHLTRSLRLYEELRAEHPITATHGG